MESLVYIQHFVVLMLSGRAFDCMLVALGPEMPQLDGLLVHRINPRHDPETGAVLGIAPVWTMSDPYPGGLAPPGDRFSDVDMQVFGLHPAANGRSMMSGFVDNYLLQDGDAHQLETPPMGYYAPQQVPVLSTLARSFAVCHRWYASVPGAAWANRLFVHAGTAVGYTDESLAPSESPTLLWGHASSTHELDC